MIKLGKSLDKIWIKVSKSVNFIEKKIDIRTPPLSWKSLITVTLVIILFLEWKRFNIIVETSPQITLRCVLTIV